MENELIGSTFPIPKPLLRGILDEEKTVFVKPSTLRLKPGHEADFLRLPRGSGAGTTRHRLGVLSILRTLKIS